MVHVNGKKVGESDNICKFTAYVSPYFVVSNGGAYTKHIYAANQRIASKLGNVDGFGADPRRVEMAGGKKYDDNQSGTIKARFEALNIDYSDGNGKKDDEEYEPTMDSEAEEKLIFFYHPDHLGSTSYVTDADGNIAQHVEYIPYGEVFVEERNSQFSTNFLFNAKELDNETGLYYYGARYLDPTGAMWLSVDPLFEKYAGMSPYNYCAGNPVVMVDPDGRDLEDSETKRTAFIISMNASSMANALEKDMNDYPESCDVAETKARIAQLRKTVEDINVMKNDKKHVYKFTKTNCLVGETKVDADGRHIEILYNENDLANLVHEIRHGGQRARGEMKFADCDDEYGNPSVIKSHDYDILKEIDAYSAQVAYGGKMEIDLYCEENDEHYKNNIILIENGYGSKKIITHVYDVTIDFVRSIRKKEPDLLGRYKNIRVYGSW